MQIMEIKRREILTGRRYFLLNNDRKALELDLDTMRHLEEGRGWGGGIEVGAGVLGSLVLRLMLCLWCSSGVTVSVCPYCLNARKWCVLFCSFLRTSPGVERFNLIKFPFILWHSLGGGGAALRDWTPLLDAQPWQPKRALRRAMYIYTGASHRETPRTREYSQMNSQCRNATPITRETLTSLEKE
jgi:hypothetical protein